MTTDLIIPQGQALADVFRSAEAVDPIIRRIKDEVKSHAPDLTTAKGRDAIKSLAYKVSRSKTALDDAGKKLTEDARAQIAVIDKARKKIRDELDAIRDEARKPLTDWEAAEEARVARAKQALADVTLPQLTGIETSYQIREYAETIKAVVRPNDAGEYADMIDAAREATLETLRNAYAAAKRNEDQAAELEALRAERQAREEAERAERERQAAEADAKRLAEERESARIEARRVLARGVARLAAERATKEAEERHARELQEAKEREEAAAQRERDRIAKERQAEADARAKRLADEAHRARIQNQIADKIAEMFDSEIAIMVADRVSDALMSGAIPHVKVEI